MKNLTRVFEYIFYRVATFHFRWDGRGAITAICSVSLIQTILIPDFVYFISGIVFSREEIKLYSKPLIYSLVVLSIVLSFINERYFKNRFTKFMLRWKEETRVQRFCRGWLVLISFFLPWAVLLLL